MRAFRDQHFLSDEGAVQKIASLLDLSGRKVLEIGPGKGVLTQALLEKGAKVSAVELDQVLIGHLRDLFSGPIAEDRLTIISGDATKVDLPEFEVVVANLPYSISSPITFRLLYIGFESAILMYQKEFADRMLAPAGSRDCGRLSIMVQTYARVKRCFDLPPGAFSPPPEVHSTVVWIEPRPPLFPITDPVIYSEVVRILFTQRRKTVRSILKSAAGQFGSEKIQSLFESVHPDILTSRPEALYLEDFATIANHFASG